jgi:hypothetical protein
MWQVIRELPGGKPELMYETPRYDRATEMVYRVAEQSAAARGTKVYLRKPESTDQLQVSKGGVILRDQPHLPAYGENVTVVVPEPAKARVR